MSIKKSRGVAVTIALLLCTHILGCASPGDPLNVRDFGASGNGTSLDSPAINRAIEAAANRGGGTVIVPAGIYLCGSIHLHSNIHLLIDAGALILGAPQRLKAYDPAEPFHGKLYQDSGHTYFHNSLIWGENLRNVSITGRGRINGGGLSIDTTQGNKSISLKLCSHVLIRDIIIEHGGWFAILATGCDNITFDHLLIDTNRDGMDIDCCRQTIVSDCQVNSPNDDGICIKSSCALGKPRVTEDLVIHGCQVSGFAEGTLIDGTMKPGGLGCGRIKFGTESSGGFRNCSVSNCTFRECRGLAIEEVDGGVLENIVVTNLAMMNVRDYAIFITTGERNRTPNLTANSRARNISISNVIADRVDNMAGIEINGLPEQPVEGVRLENIRLFSKGGGTQKDAATRPSELGTGYPEPNLYGRTPAYGVYARHVHDLELANIHFGFQKNELRPAAAFFDVTDLEIDNVKPQLASGVPAALISPDVQNIVIRNSPAFDPQTKRTE